MTELKYKGGMTFSQTKKASSSLSTNKIRTSFQISLKELQERIHESKFKNKTQTAVSGTKLAVTTDKNKTIHRKLISNPLPFQQTTTTPAKKINTRQSTADQPTCSKTLDTVNNGRAPCINSRKEAPKAIANYERSED